MAGAAPAIETRSFDQLPKAAVAQGTDLIPFQAPGGPVQAIELAKLVGKLGPADFVFETADELTLAEPNGSLAIVWGDPDPAKLGYHIKNGDPGQGSWVQSQVFRGGTVLDVPDGADWAISGDLYWQDAAGDGAADDRAALAQAAADLPAGAEVTIDRGRFKIGSSIEVANPVRFNPGGRLVVPNGVTVTLQGPVTAAPVHIFECSGNGKVVLGAGTREVHPAWWGAKCDGVALDTAALQAAIDAAAAIRANVIMPTNIKHGALTLRAGASLIGADSKCKAIGAAGSYDLLTIVDSDVSVKNVEWQLLAKTGGAEIHISCGNQVRDRITLKDLLFWFGTGGLKDSGAGDGFHVTTMIDNIQFRGHRGPGGHLTRAFAFVFPKHYTVDYVGVPNANYLAFFADFGALPEGAGGIFFDHLDVLGTANMDAPVNQRGLYIRNAAAVGLARSRLDTCGEHAGVLENVNLLSILDLSLGKCGGHGLICINVSNVTGSVLTGFGRRGLPNALPDACGLLFAGTPGASYAVQLTSVVMRDFTGDGIRKAVAQAGPINITGATLVANGGYGARSQGDSAFTVIGTFAGNELGDYLLGGEYDFVLASQINNGRPIVATKYGTTDLGALGRRPLRTFEGDAYQLSLADQECHLRLTSAQPVTITIPPASQVPLPLGMELDIEQAGDGAVTVVAGAGVTVGFSGGNPATGGKFARRRIKNVGGDAWIVSRDS